MIEKYCDLCGKKVKKFYDIEFFKLHIRYLINDEVLRFRNEIYKRDRAFMTCIKCNKRVFNKLYKIYKKNKKK